MLKSVGVIINAASGAVGLENRISVLRKSFLQHGVTAEFFLAHQGNSITDVTKKIIHSGYKLIAVSGGDGTISGVAGEILNTDICLGILPSGTFNHLAQDLRIPLALDEAVNIIVNGISKKIDAAEVNGQIFINNSSIGIYSKLVRYRDDHHKIGWGKKMALVRAAFNLLYDYTFLNVEIDVNGEHKLFKTPLAFVGNNKYSVEGLSIGTRSSLDNGELCLYVVKHSSRWDLIKLGLHGLINNLHSHEQFVSYSAKSIKFQTRKAFLKVAIDGEIVSLPSPLTYTIRPLALTVKVPNV